MMRGSDKIITTKRMEVVGFLLGDYRGQARIRLEP